MVISPTKGRELLLRMWVTKLSVLRGGGRLRGHKEGDREVGVGTRGEVET